MVDIVGRIAQRAQLARWLGGAIHGQPVVVAVEGPAGIGKSTLVDWLAARATDLGAAVRRVDVPETGDTAGEITAEVTSAEQQLRGGGPQLLIIDDAHWLDDAGQHTVERLAFRLGTAASTGQAARFALVLVARDTGSRLMARLVDEPIIRRMPLTALDDRETVELARRRVPSITDRRTVGRLAELSGGNPLTVAALADSLSVGDTLPPPSSSSGTIPVEQAWRARLSTLDRDALRAAVVVALAERVAERDVDSVLPSDGDAIARLEAIGAVHRRGRGVVFSHPLLRTTTLALAPSEDVAALAARVLASLQDGPADCEAGTLVRLSTAAGRAGTSQHLALVLAAYEQAIATASWSSAGDLAEQLAAAAPTTGERALWTQRVGQARFNELDRDAATTRLIEAAALFGECASGADDASECAARRAECLLLALRTDFTRSGPRRHRELDDAVRQLIDDASLSADVRCRAAAILAEASHASPDHRGRARLVETAVSLLTADSPPLTVNMVQFAAGLHHLAVLSVDDARRAFEVADAAAVRHTDPWWSGGSLARRAGVELMAGSPMDAVSFAARSMERSASVGNWAEHAMAVAMRSVGETRLGRFTDADNDFESVMLGARRADSSDPFLVALAAAMWRRAAGGDVAGVDTLIALAERAGMRTPAAALVAECVLGRDDARVEEGVRWRFPRGDLGARNLGFHLAQLEAATLLGDLDAGAALFASIEPVAGSNVVAAFDWPLSIALVLAGAAVELSEPSATDWLERAGKVAAEAGSELERALVDLSAARWSFATGAGGQGDLDRARDALAVLENIGAPLLARLHRRRLVSFAPDLPLPAVSVRTVMFTDIVDSTPLMASAGNTAWALLLAEHHRIIRSVVTRHRGTVMTATGDGFAAWFADPDDAADAALAVHDAIAHAALHTPAGTVWVRVGLASGSVFDLDGDASGLAVAEAARVMSTANGGDTHLSRSVIDHGLDPARARPLGVRSLKGLPQPTELFCLSALGSRPVEYQ